MQPLLKNRQSLPLKYKYIYLIKTSRAFCTGPKTSWILIVIHQNAPTNPQSQIVKATRSSKATSL